MVLNEVTAFEELVDCAEGLELMDEWPSIVRIIAGILHLGNIEFVDFGDGGSAVSADTVIHAAYAAELLSIEEGHLKRALTNHTLKTKVEITVSPLTPSKAADSRQALAKNIYGCLFNWREKRLNKTMEPKDVAVRAALAAIGGAGGGGGGGEWHY